MGICATYYALSDDQLQACRTSIQGDAAVYYQLTGALYDTEHCMDLDKLWDGLHFLLTGCTGYDGKHYDGTGGKTPEQIALYDGFFGRTDLADGLDMPIRVLDKARVADTVQALEKTDIDDLIRHMDLAVFDEKQIYPGYWQHDADEMPDLFREAFCGFKHFYKTALKNGRSILVAID